MFLSIVRGQLSVKEARHKEERTRSFARSDQSGIISVSTDNYRCCLSMKGLEFPRTPKVARPCLMHPAFISNLQIPRRPSDRILVCAAHVKMRPHINP